jgi:triosephosphate isomerase
MIRKPLAQANWKMAMTIAESQTFVCQLASLTGDLLERVDVVISPPYTALHAVSQAIHGMSLQLGAQNLADTDDYARTGQVSARLLADLGCQWVMLGHWEVRRWLGDDDQIVRRKIDLALQSGLRPFLLVGPAQAIQRSLEDALAEQLDCLLDGCQPEQVRHMAFVFEPETAIGQAAPLAPQTVATGCLAIRRWIAGRFGDRTAAEIRIIYGGSVSPGFSRELLTSPDVDGLGASRQGRDPAVFAEIVRQIALAKF